MAAHAAWPSLALVCVGQLLSVRRPRFVNAPHLHTTYQHLLHSHPYPPALFLSVQSHLLSCRKPTHVFQLKFTCGAIGSYSSLSFPFRSVPSPSFPFHSFPFASTTNCTAPIQILRPLVLVLLATRPARQNARTLHAVLRLPRKGTTHPRTATARSRTPMTRIASGNAHTRAAATTRTATTSTPLAVTYPLHRAPRTRRRTPRGTPRNGPQQPAKQTYADPRQQTLRVPADVSD